MIGKMVKLIKQCHQTSKTAKNKHAAQPYFTPAACLSKNRSAEQAPESNQK